MHLLELLCNFRGSASLHVGMQDSPLGLNPRSNKQKTFMDTPVYKRVAAALKNGVFWSFCAARSSSFRLKEFFTFNESGWKEQFLHFFLCFLNEICCWFFKIFVLCPKLLCLENQFEFIWNLKSSFQIWTFNSNLKEDNFV